MDQYSQLRRFGLWDTNVPRYTSYPPAGKFSDAIGAAQYRGWVSQLPAGSEVSIYLHVPYCKRLCWFCSARTQGASGPAPVSAYVDALIAEINLLRATLPQGVRASQVYWGGGTPTILSPADITRLSDSLHSALPLTATPEITVEVDPTEIDADRLDALAAMGMTRASIGVQDFDPAVQKIIGRAQSFEVTKATVDALRARGVQGLSMGLLYGLPQQSRARVALTTQLMLSLAPDRVAVQAYAHVPAIARRQNLIPTDALPTPEGQLRLFDAAAEVLAWDGFVPVGIDHFALPDDALARAAQTGQLRRGFDGYNDHVSGILLGLGASAVSRLPQGFAQNAPATAAYLRAIERQRFATTRGHALTSQDALRGRMIEMLLCDFQISLARLTQEGFGPRAQAKASALIKQILRQFPGQVTATPEGLQVADHATALVRVIARVLDAHTKG